MKWKSKSRLRYLPNIVYDDFTHIDFADQIYASRPSSYGVFTIDYTGSS
jgi:hypothetical protein